MTEFFNKINNSRKFQNFIIGVIFASVLLAGIETLPLAQACCAAGMRWLEWLIMAVFVIEVTVRIGAHGARPWRFFSSLWNLFDFILIAVYLLPASQFTVVLRLARVLRILRLLNSMQQAELDRLRHIELQRAYHLLEQEKQKSERLLLNILPQIIAQRLKDDVSKTIIADTYPEATVLFADIVGFTAMSSHISPQDLVVMLDRVFSGMDALAQKHGLEKIKTIGDAYMVAAGIPEPRPDHAEAVAAMALDMLEQLAELNRAWGTQLNLRIGFHSGPVVAGVIGQTKFIYDLWGDTVNTASRMESNSLPGQIQVPESTCQRLRDTYEFEDRGEISIKGKGEMRVYFLKGRK